MNSSQSVINNLHDQLQNPEGCEEEARCRICYQQCLPLVALCHCCGSMRYVHEDCIRDWIAKKMCQAASLEVPSCEVCRQQYLATVTLSSTQPSIQTIIQNAKNLGSIEITISLLFIIGMPMAFFLIAQMLFQIVSSIAGLSQSIYQGSIAIDQKTFSGWYTMIIFPAYFLREAVRHCRGRLRSLKYVPAGSIELVLAPSSTLTK